MPYMLWNALYSLDLLAISLFAISYYRNCYRRGYRIDFWHTQLFLACVFPNMIMLPFARSELNAVVLGRDFAAVIAVLPAIFLLTLLGYFAILAGGGFWRLRVGLGMRKAATRLLDTVPRCSMMLMSSRSLLVFQSLLCGLLQGLILIVYFAHNGFGFDLRSYTFSHPELRPPALLASNYSVIIASHCVARYIDKKEKVLLACALLLTFGLVFFGARSSLLAIYVNILLCYMIKLRARISLIRLVGTISIIIVVGLYLGSVRAGQYSLGEFFGVLASLLLFGDTFSDLRDFAWVYAKWDHVFWAGKTYLAALTSFIPRVASQFRDAWGLGAATATTVGFDPQVHPGLRPGVFGEGFFNFGWLGVILVGIMLGIVVRRVDIDVKRALSAPDPSMMKAFASSQLLSVAGSLAITAGFSGLYILGGIYLFSWLCLRALELVQPHRISLAKAD
jgi:oligosaccharide repeat unit polymerase